MPSSAARFTLKHARLTLAIASLIALASPASAADPIRVYAAGSLSAVVPQLIAGAGLGEESVALPVFGPAGILRHRIEVGERADLFLSADIAQPTALASQPGVIVVPFARNRMCIAAPQRLGLTADTLLDRLLSPDLRLATSTPGADPGGDYAIAVFARAEALHPGAQAILMQKALLLLGGLNTMSPQPGHSPVASIFLGDHADALLYYCSGSAGLLRELPDMVSIPLPASLEVGPVYAMAVLTDRPEAARLALFTLSQQGQALLAKAGLLPILPAQP